jgi:4-hydroxy-tetrahydrodipicolinate synthase
VLKAWREGGDAAAVQETLTDVRTAFAPLPTIPALKEILAQRHNAPSWATVRPPLASLSDEEIDMLHDVVQLLTETAPTRGSTA